MKCSDPRIVILFMQLCLDYRTVLTSFHIIPLVTVHIPYYYCKLCPSFRSSVNLSIRTYLSSFIHQLISPSVCPSFLPSVRPSACPSICLFVLTGCLLIAFSSSLTTSSPTTPGHEYSFVHVINRPLDKDSILTGKENVKAIGIVWLLSMT